MKFNGLMAVLVWVCCAANAESGFVYDCSLTYEGGGTQVVAVGQLTDNKWLNLEMDVPLPDGKAVASLDYHNEKLELMMGDFCGEHYQLTELEFDPAFPPRKIYSKYSYGREPGTDNWRTLILDCQSSCRGN